MRYPGHLHLARSPLYIERQCAVPMRRLLILFFADLLIGAVSSRFHHGIVSLIFLALLVVNIGIFIKVSESDAEKLYRWQHPRAGANSEVGISLCICPVHVFSGC